jgi:hypothetical protein
MTKREEEEAERKLKKNHKWKSTKEEIMREACKKEK